MNTNPAQNTHSLKYMLSIKTASLLSIGLLLAACNGGGTETVPNPFLGGNTTANQGPPAATEDVRAFEINVWNNIKSDNRCGQCHGNGAQAPTFADNSDVNLAYSEAVPIVNLADPASSLMVTKVGAGHNCWEAVDSICADTLENMISNWAGADNSNTTRGIDLEAPTIKDPGDSKNFPATAMDNGSSSFNDTIYPLLTTYCSSCHYEEGDIQQQSPFFANPADVDSSYAAAKSKINIDNPENSRFVLRLLEGHNCWSDCGTLDPNTSAIDGDAGEMLDQIRLFAGAITPTTVGTNLIISKALTLQDGVIASGGERHEANLVALWEFKAGTGSTAYDTSGIEPSVNLSLSGSVSWLGSYGLDMAGGKAQADTQTSQKIYNFIKTSGEYSVEAWVVPANVTQEDANIISYDAGSTNKDFALTQDMYNYHFHNRSDQSDANGEPFLNTEDAGEIAQSSLQHVVATFDPVGGRKIYVNGELVNVTDPSTLPSALSGWANTYAFVLGQSASNSNTWLGMIRLAAIHNRALTPSQISQNFEAGVGEKYFLLFSVAEQLGIADSYIMFEVSQYDSYSYLFDKPTFINLNPDWTPGGFTIGHMRLGINGKEAVAGQTYANLTFAVDSSYSPDTGQLLSSMGAVIALEKGPESDEFFLSFEILGAKNQPYNDPTPVAPTPGADAAPVSDIGIRTFEEINASIAKMTNIPVTNTAVLAVYTRYQQQLPSTESIDAFLSSHQMAVAQLALTSCSERVEIDASLPTGDSSRLFTNVDFSESSGIAFNSATKRAYVIDPILSAVLLNNLTSSPATTEISDLLGSSSTQSLTGESEATLVDPDGILTDNSYDSLISELNNADTSARTKEIVKAVCAAAVGSAAMLIQ